MRKYFCWGGALAAFCLSLPSVRAEAPAVPGSRAEISFSYSSVVKKVSPTVVNIYTKRKMQGLIPLIDDPFFGGIFGPFTGTLPLERVQNALGSGVIIQADGIVITNHHIIEGASEIRVALQDGREFEAKIIIDDAKTDLALLKIQGHKGTLPFLELRSIDTLEVGDLVLAVGNPLGVGQSVTSGIISALARTHIGQGRYRYYIQTDASINRGNSGGALVGLDGKLIGINTFILSPSGGSHGVGFAIPADLIRSLLAGAARGGEIIRPWLGVKHAPISSEVAEALGLPHAQGAQIGTVMKGSPAEKAGLQVGDIVTKVDGRLIEDAQAFVFRIGTRSVGDTVTLHILRKEKALDIPVTLAAPSDIPERKKTTLKGSHPLRGITICNINPAVISELAAPISEDMGVVVFAVDPQADLELLPGDTLLKVNGKKVASVDEVQEALATPVPVWRFSIKRGEQVYKLRFQR